MDSRKVVLGIGASPNETEALARFLSAQNRACVSHEASPVLDWQCSQAQSPRLNRRIARLRQQSVGQLVGDVAMSYLPYLGPYLAENDDIFVLGVRDERHNSIASLQEEVRWSYSYAVNHWLKNPWTKKNEQVEFHCPIRSRLFPKFNDVSVDQGIARFWDEYNETMDTLKTTYPDNVFVIDMSALRTSQGQIDVLKRLGVNDPCIVGDQEFRRTQPSQFRGITRDDTDQLTSPSRCVVIVPYLASIPEACESGLRELARRGYAIRRVPMLGDPFDVNLTLTESLCEGYTETLWISPSVKFHPDAVDVLREHRADISCIPVFDLSGNTESFNFGDGKEVRFGRSGDIVEVESASLSFLHVRRYVYEAMVEYMGLPLVQRGNKFAVPFFLSKIEFIADSDRYLTPSQSFCAAAKALGFSVIADCRIRIWNMQPYAFSWEDGGLSLNRSADYTIRF